MGRLAARPGAHLKWAMKRGLLLGPSDFCMPDGSKWWLRRGSWECYGEPD